MGKMMDKIKQANELYNEIKKQMRLHIVEGVQVPFHMLTRYQYFDGAIDFLSHEIIKLRMANKELKNEIRNISRETFMIYNVDDGEECHHKGCSRHLSHPCELCGRLGSKGVAKYSLKELRDLKTFHHHEYNKLKESSDADY